MSGLIEIVRRVVAQETARHRMSLLGVVSTVFPHTADDDENNYEVNVRLKHEDLELRKVPVAVAHVGVAAPPRVGDLVLVQFINGDLNQPVITGRFYHNDERPPLHQEEEILFEQRVSDNTLNHLRFTADGTIFLQRDVKKPEDNSEAQTSLRIDGATGNLEIKVGDRLSVTLTSDNEIQITADDKPVNVNCSKLTVNGDMDLNGKLVVSDGTHSTTIEGNSIGGA
jgi:phage baseplate assembly protein gpV